MIAIDSNVLVYAGMVPSGINKSSVGDDLTIRARLLLHMGKDDPMVFPTIALSEVLIPVLPEKRGELTALLLKRFICPSFDARAASIAADLWVKYKKFPQSDQYARQVVRADAMIIASAVAAGASKFYTHDRKCRKLAEHVMTALDLPARDPSDMFAAEDIRRGDL